MGGRQDIVDGVSRGNNALAASGSGAPGEPAHDIAGFLVVKCLVRQLVNYLKMRQIVLATEHTMDLVEWR